LNRKSNRIEIYFENREKKETNANKKTKYE
jgi:hypothetical protein